MGTIVKEFDRIEVTGFCGYDPKVWRQYQTEKAFIEHTWPVWLRFRGFRESVYGLAHPAIFFCEDGPDWKLYTQVIPVKLEISVVFGHPYFRDA